MPVTAHGFVADKIRIGAEHNRAFAKRALDDRRIIAARFEHSPLRVEVVEVQRRAPQSVGGGVGVPEFEAPALLQRDRLESRRNLFFFVTGLRALTLWI